MKKIVPSLAAALLFVASAGVQTYKDGTYTGKAQGKEGEIEVSVNISAGKIANVEVVKHEDTEALMLGVIDNIVPEIVEKQTTEGIDAVTGATMSSTGVLEAAKQALEQAKS
ncbi:MAG: FMN-binding protein [Symbiopectobacterium sp.]|uniref:FMN-binding protein n=1 Tax=Symbiopectobacterium sp. TaxID=2952789 RepID=UPI0039ED8433